MKKILVLLAVLSLAAGMAMPAQAALVTINFDDYLAGTRIDDEYSSYGVTFSGHLMRHLPSFGQALDPQNSTYPLVLYYNAKPTDGMITFTDPVDEFSFYFRRPSVSGDIYLKVYNDDTLVHI